MSDWQYTEIPDTPPDFEGACRVLSLANKAIDYWEEEMKHIDNLSAQYHQSKATLKDWRRCKKNAAVVISTYQLSLF